MPETSVRPVIVHADHSEMHPRIVAKIVERAGIVADVVPVDDCRTAIRLRFATPAPAMLIVRGAMPGLDGPGAIAEIRRREAEEGLSRIPIAIVSGGSDYLARGLEAGADVAIPAPLRSEDIRVVVSAMLSPGFTGPLLLPPPPVTGPPGDASRPLPLPPPVDPAAIPVRARRILLHDRGNRLVMLREWLAGQPGREAVSVAQWDLGPVALPDDLAVVEMVGVGMCGAFHIQTAREHAERMGRAAPAFVLVVADVMGGVRRTPGLGLGVAYDSALRCGVGDVSVIGEAELVAILRGATSD